MSENEGLNGVEVDADVSTATAQADGVLDGDADEVLGDRAGGPVRVRIPVLFDP